MGYNFDLTTIEIILPALSFRIISNRLIAGKVSSVSATTLWSSIISYVVGDGIPIFVDLFFGDQGGFPIEVWIGKETGGGTGVV